MVSDPTELSCTSPEYRIVSDPAELPSLKYCCNPVRVSVVVAVEVELVAAVAVVEVVAVVVAAVSVMVDTLAVGVAAVVLAAAAALVAAALAAAALLRLLAAVLAAAIPTTNLEAFLFWSRRHPTAMPTLPRRLTVKRKDMTTTASVWSTAGSGHSDLVSNLSAVGVSDAIETLTGRAHLGAQAPRSSLRRDATVLTTGTRSFPMIPTFTGMLFVMSNFCMYRPETSWSL